MEIIQFFLKLISCDVSSMVNNQADLFSTVEKLTYVSKNEG